MILVTGGYGFIGSALCTKLSEFAPLRTSVRSERAFVLPAKNIEIFQASLSSNQEWSSALHGVSVVIHCAARVHVVDDRVTNSLFQFRQVNVGGTLNLALQAARAGVRRFIFISSIKVNGNFTELNQPFLADQLPLPTDPYGISKYEAEEALIALSHETGMEVVIIRPPLVYGPGVKANFLSMLNWLQSGFPLPLGDAKENRRSFVFIDNLISLIIACVNHPVAANQIFLVSDDEDLSTAVLLERMALALGRASNLVTVPTGLILLGARITGRSDIAQRLYGSLQVDINKTKDLLGWSPPVSLDDGLRKTAAHFLKMRA